MALCWSLEEFSFPAEWPGQVEIVARSTKALEAFAGIVSGAYPTLVRLTPPYETGMWALQYAARFRLRTTTDSEGLEKLLRILKKILTIEDELDESHAIDYHQDSDEETGELSRTTIGELVYQAKYLGKSAAFRRICEILCGIVSAHPRYRAAAAVAAIPRHNGANGGLAERLAREVATQCGLSYHPLLRVSRREEQKSIRSDDRRDGARSRFENQRESMAARPVEEAVVLIDELYGSGASMTEGARALRAAGAPRVYGLAVTKQRLFGSITAIGW